MKGLCTKCAICWSIIKYLLYQAKVSKLFCENFWNIIGPNFFLEILFVDDIDSLDLSYIPLCTAKYLKFQSYNQIMIIINKSLLKKRYNLHAI